MSNQDPLSNYLSPEEQDSILDVGVRVADVSKTKEMLDEHNFTSKEEMYSFLVNNPKEFKKIYLAGYTITANNRVLEMYGVDTIKEYQKLVMVSWREMSWTKHHSRLLCRLYFSNEVILRLIHDLRADGQRIWTYHKTMLAPGHEKDWKRLITLVLATEPLNTNMQEVQKIRRLQAIETLTDFLSGTRNKQG